MGSIPTCVFYGISILFSVAALQLVPVGRREVLQTGGAAFASLLVADENDEKEPLRATFRSFSANGKNQPPTLIPWSPTSRDFSELRYSTSTLPSQQSMVPQTSCKSLPPLPSWMEGHWLITYKFEGVAFPQGRDKVTLRVPGAGLGTCIGLPNVGYNPSPLVQRYVATPDGGVIEDTAYNLPRKLEGFWQQAKVQSVRVSTPQQQTAMGPVCRLTGDGCSEEENPSLHGPSATRCKLEFEVPTRGGGLRSQHLDVSMIDWKISDRSNIKNNTTDEEFIMGRSFVQYNEEQEYTGYFREFVSFDRLQQTSQSPKVQQSTGRLKGRTRIAAFLPSCPEAVALYSYTMRCYSITAEEAMLY